MNLSFSYAYLVKAANAMEIALSILVYTHSLCRRPHFLPRLTGCLCVLFAFLAPATLLYMHYSNSFINASITGCVYLCMFAILYICFEEHSSELLLCLCSGLATQNIVGRCFELLYILQGKNPYASLHILPSAWLPEWGHWLVYLLLHAFLILLLGYPFRFRKVAIHDSSYTNLIVIFSVTICISTIAINTFSRPFENQSAELSMVIRLMCILYSLLVLFARSGLLEQSRINTELRTTEELLCAEKKQFETIREDMDMINMLCHDLRHQLNQYAGKLTAEELQGLKDIIQNYDASFQTGSDVLDMLLFKKQALCTQDHIQISCMADGALLNFILPADLYSLLNNALENAIEAVQKLPDPSMRIIDLRIGMEQGLIAIRFSNYFIPDSSSAQGTCTTLQTTKEDSSRHGYGTKSMQYLVQKYGGKILFEPVGTIFHLTILFPPKDTSV